MASWEASFVQPPKLANVTMNVRSEQHRQTTEEQWSEALATENSVLEKVKLAFSP
jgi:hypothetical protein